MRCGVLKKAGEFYHLGDVEDNLMANVDGVIETITDTKNRRRNINPFLNKFNVDVRNKAVEYITKEIIPKLRVGGKTGPGAPVDISAITSWKLLFGNSSATYSLHSTSYMEVAPGLPEIYGIVLYVHNTAILYSFKLSSFVHIVYEDGVPRYDRSGTSVVSMREWLAKELPDVPRHIENHPVNDDLWRNHRGTLLASVRAIAKSMFSASGAQAASYAEHFVATFVDILSQAERMAYYIETNPKNLQAVISNYRRWSAT